ncbi:hypothetical protein CPter91_3473 [Collimonas pratensis]|uniref:Uncharacterized protein n=1 Tax=Collimonas pratensis TaxID=279113 RepID=A0A127Q6W3_9BURK|nr:hypothetical protein CPter91_3473 [Collimonas pratensis]
MFLVLLRIGLITISIRMQRIFPWKKITLLSCAGVWQPHVCF